MIMLENEVKILHCHRLRLHYKKFSNFYGRPDFKFDINLAFYPLKMSIYTPSIPNTL